MSTTPPGDFVEAAVRVVLTAADDAVDTEISRAALLSACVGAADASDRLVRQWRRTTGRPVARLAAHRVTARAWAMLLSVRADAPEWADGLLPLDLDAEEDAHRAHLARLAQPGGRPGVEATLAELVERAWAHAEAGHLAEARAAVGAWAHLARDTSAPDVATLAGCRPLARLLVEGALTVPEGWAEGYVDALVAALHTRHPVDVAGPSWPELLAEILLLRGTPDAAPPPASDDEVGEAERRLGVALPESYRRFLAACDGLPADVVFPRLLRVAELSPPAAEPGGPTGTVVISEPPVLRLRPATGEVLEDDPVFGLSVHRDVRAVLEQHRRLLEASL